MSIVPIHSPIEWMINRLWCFSAICPVVNYSHENVSSVDIMTFLGFKIPDFILFRDGIPWKWIGIGDDGLLIRKIIKVSDRNNALFILEQLQAIRRQLVLSQNRYVSNHNHKVVLKYICTAFYRSGEQEKITLEKWLQYEAQTSWWKNVVALQLFISENQSGIGVFRSSDLKDGDAYLDSARKEMFDSMAKNFAKFLSPSKGDDTIYTMKVAPVLYLVVKFHVDTNNTCWLSEVLEGGLLVLTPVEIEVSRPEEEALNLTRSLRLRLSTLSQRELEILFTRWDADRDGLIIAAELSIGLSHYFETVVSNQSTAIIMAVIGRDSPKHFSLLDLQHFVDTCPKFPERALIGDETFLQTSIKGNLCNNLENEIDSGMGCGEVNLACCYCFFDYYMDDLSLDDVPTVHPDHFDLIPRDIQANSSNAIKLKVEAILDKTNVDASLGSGEKVLVVSDLEKLSNVSLNGRAPNIYILCDNLVNIFNYKANTLECGEQSVHRFMIQNGSARKLASLNISIVYSGCLKGEKYFTGHVTASLSHKPQRNSYPYSEETLYNEHTIDTEAGIVIGELQRTAPLNEKFGCISIAFCPHPFIQSGDFQLTIKADALTRYSVHISGRACISVEDVISHKLLQYFLMKKAIGDKKECSFHSWIDLRVMERRYLALVDLLNNADDERKGFQSVLEKSEALYLTTEHDEPYHLLKILNIDFSRVSLLVSLRKKQICETYSRIQKIVENRRNHSEEVSRMTDQTDSFSILLIRSIRSLFGYSNSLNAERIMNSHSIQVTVCNERHLQISSDDHLHDQSSHELSHQIPKKMVMDHDISCYGQHVDMTKDTDNDASITQDIASIRAYDVHDDSIGRNPIQIDDHMHRERDTSPDWGFWQPRPLPLLRQITSDDICHSDVDLDERLRNLMIEQDRVLDSADHSIVCHILHFTTQMFPKHKLLLDIELEMMKMIDNQIMSFEQKQLSQYESNENMHDKSSIRSDADGLKHILTYNQPEYGFCIDQLPAAFEASDFGVSQSHAVEDKLTHFCIACCHNPCRWKSAVNEECLDRRRAEISSALISIKSGKADLDYSEMINRTRDLSVEAYEVDTKVKLNRVDKELHDIYSSKSNGFIEVTSLHGYGSLMTRAGAIESLEHEHDRLIAILISNEIVDGILNWMLKGWCFGEYAEATVQEGNATIFPTDLIVDQQRKLIDITSEGKTAALLRKAGDYKVENMQMLSRLEQNVKFFFLCLTLMYFRTVDVLKKEKLSWSDNKNMQCSTTERAAITQEQNAEICRKEAFTHAFTKMRIGVRREKSKADTEALKKVRQSSVIKQEAEKTISSLTIQRVYRGYLGRKVYRKWSRAKARYDAWNALCHACAIAISRVWRGYNARKRVSMMKRALAQFILRLRQYDHEISKKAITSCSSSKV